MIIAGSAPDLSGFSLFELFRSEAETQSALLTQGLLALDRDAGNLAAIEPLMRAAHSIKGAAAIVDLPALVEFAHQIENCLVLAQQGALQLNAQRIDALLAAVDIITRVAAQTEENVARWLDQHAPRLAHIVLAMAAADDSTVLASPMHPMEGEIAAAPEIQRDNVLKISTDRFDALLSFASQTRVAANALVPFVLAMERHKRRQSELFDLIEQLHQNLDDEGTASRLRDQSQLILEKMAPLRALFGTALSEVDSAQRRLISGTRGMLDAVLALRMRPFRDGTSGFPRMMRDLARSLGKDVLFQISGEATLIDRDILTQIESPLTHLLRNALDHGMETPAARLAVGKPAQGRIRLDARHSAGLLRIEVSDDGTGVDIEQVRRAVVARNLSSAAMAAELTQAELLAFLLLPAFSMKTDADHVSGRGVGLDVVHATVRQLQGNLQMQSEPGQRFSIVLTLPLSQSLVRALVIEISGEAYAIQISSIDRIVKLPLTDIHVLEDKQFFTLDGQHVGLISASQLLSLGQMAAPAGELPVIVLGGTQQRYGLAVDGIIGEFTLAVQSLEAVFGKLRDVASAALLDDGRPALLLDVPDLLVSIDKLLGDNQLHALQALQGATSANARARKRVLVVDDSMTVREMERKLLLARGFAVDVAIDGVDGWNAVRSVDYDLIITDVDMPRMNGIELVLLIRKDVRLNRLPVMIVSYKDRPEDRNRGIDAGANYYLTKGSFHDATLLDAVVDLIGESEA